MNNKNKNPLHEDLSDPIKNTGQDLKEEDLTRIGNNEIKTIHTTIGNEHSNKGRSGNSSIPPDEEDTAGIP